MSFLGLARNESGLSRLLDDNDSIFNMVNSALYRSNGWIEHKGNMVKRIDLPGHLKENIKVSLLNDWRVRVKAETKDEVFGDRISNLVFTLPYSSNNSDIEAEYKNGVLELKLKKSVREKSEVRVT